MLGGNAPPPPPLPPLGGGAAARAAPCLVPPRLEPALRRALLRDPPLAAAARLSIARDCAAGLQALHAAGLVHRDLKAANVLLDASDGAKLADFGLVRSSGGGQTRVGGTGAYMDPEYAASGELRTSSDVYSLGVVLLELLTGTQADGDGFG